ncbi:MAG TPA: hypothetical protein ENK19_09340 [Acidobacteria bacterium]|nr:hypothetical protein [Acidobacteriota bacterium]
MDPEKIYGLMMFHGVKVGDIAAQEGVHPSLVHKAIRGDRTGPAAQRVREHIAKRLGKPVSALWEEDREQRRTNVA